MLTQHHNTMQSVLNFKKKMPTQLIGSPGPGNGAGSVPVVLKLDGLEDAHGGCGLPVYPLGNVVRMAVGSVFKQGLPLLVHAWTIQEAL